KRRHRCDLPAREIRIAVVMAGIGDLDADRTGIDIGLAGPRRLSRMPGAPRLRHALDDTAVLENHVVGRHLARRQAQMAKGGFRVGHASIMQYQHVRLYAAPALAVVWRLSNLCDDAGFGLKLRHEQDHLRDHPLVGPAWTVRNTLLRKRRSGAAGICAGKRAGHKLPFELGLELSSELAKLSQA